MALITRIIKDCPACDGRGEIAIIAPASLRRARLRAGISIRTLAKALKFSAPYLSDVERGRRNCTAKIEKAYAKL